MGRMTCHEEFGVACYRNVLCCSLPRNSEEKQVVKALPAIILDTHGILICHPSDKATPTCARCLKIYTITQQWERLPEHLSGHTWFNCKFMFELTFFHVTDLSSVVFQWRCICSRSTMPSGRYDFYLQVLTALLAAKACLFAFPS